MPNPGGTGSAQSAGRSTSPARPRSGHYSAPIVPFPFVIGHGRSGTTLLRAMLEASPELVIPPESYFIPTLDPSPRPFEVDTFVDRLLVHRRMRWWDVDWDVLRAGLLDEPPATYADAVRRVFAIYAAAHDKTRYGDKTPGYAHTVAHIAALLPEARFVHLVRDGRDVAPALVRTGWGAPDLGGAVVSWQHAVERARRDGLALERGRYVEVRYEDLVDDPATVVRMVCDFIELPFDPTMLHPEDRAERMVSGFGPSTLHENLRRPISKNLRDWRRDLADGDVAVLEALVGRTLDVFDYERRFPHVPLGARARAPLLRARHWMRVKRRRVRVRLALAYRRVARAQDSIDSDGATYESTRRTSRSGRTNSS